MNVTTNGYMEMYGTLIGWFYYDRVVQLFLDTGLILIIPIIIVIMSWKNAETGEDALAGSEKAVKQVMVGSISMVLFIAFMYLPYVTISPSQISFEIEDGQVVNLENNDSTFSGRFDQNAYENVRAPLGWAGMMQVAGGINTYLLKQFPEVRGLREEIMSVKSVNIKNPMLRKEVNRFHDECYSKAVHYLTKEESQVDPIIGVDITPSEFWPGSDKIIEVYGQFNACSENCPPIFRAAKPVAGFAVDPRFDVEPEFADGGEVFGRPLCSSWWNDKLKDLIYADAVSSGVSLDRLDAIKDVFVGFDQDKVKDMIVYKTMTNKQDIRVSNPNMQYADYDRFSGGHIQGGIANVGLSYEAAKTSSATYSATRALPIIQGWILVIFYFSLPILQLIGRLSWKSFGLIAIGWFSVKLWPVWWQLGRWADEFFIGSSIPFDEAAEGVFTGFDGAVLDRSLLDFILIMTYMVAPFVFSIFLSWAGYSMIDRINNSANSSAASTGRGAQAISDKIASVGISRIK